MVKKTRREKIAAGQKAGKSRYALKVSRRKKLAQAENLPSNSPMPLLKSQEFVEVDETIPEIDEPSIPSVDQQADSFEAWADGVTQAEMEAEIAAVRQYNS
jgi:hypothetical protein